MTKPTPEITLIKEEYEPLKCNVYKFQGTREGLQSIFNSIMGGVNSTQYNKFSLRLELKEIVDKTDGQITTQQKEKST